MWVEGWMPLDDSPYLLPHLPPGSEERGVRLSLYPLEVAAAQMTLQQGRLQMCLTPSGNTISYGQSSTQMAQLWVELSVWVAQL
jgi:hypothetical protein